MVSLAILRQELDALNGAVKICIEEHEKTLSKLRQQKEKAAIDYNRAVEGLDIERIRSAESVITVRGADHVGKGDTNSAITQAVQWFACSYAPTHYTDLKRVFFGCKNYDRWVCQRDDCEYGYGPRHGSTVFAIQLNKEFRGENTGLTEQQRSDCIYYLEALRAGKLKTQAAA